MKSSLGLISLVLVTLTVLTSGCRMQDLAFREDDRIEIVAPKDRSEVAFPLTIRWVSRETIPGLESFVVAVDRSPQAPGKGLDAFVNDLDECEGEALDFCLQPEYLANLGIHQTTQPEITLDDLPKRTGVSKSEENRHEVTVALLDAAGQRMSEAGWTVVFTARDIERT